MNKEEAKLLISESVDSFTYKHKSMFLDWLYDSGFEVIDNLPKKDNPPKSKFMEEYENMPSKTWDEMINLIDKHKADK